MIVMWHLGVFNKPYNKFKIELHPNWIMRWREVKKSLNSIESETRKIH